LNLKIRRNETVALVGESGCGKSTIVSLILRFYDANKGTILLDGVDIRDYKVADLRRAMGFVMQEPVLFNYTIYENILYGKSEARNGEIYEAAKIANALDFIESKEIEKAFEDTSETVLAEMDKNQKYLKAKLGEQQFAEKRAALDKVVKEDIKKGKFLAVEGDVDHRSPDLKQPDLSRGFEIQCGIKGSKLSGGQKQSIARAVIREPRILILDEATSALDEESQRKVQVALDNIMQNRTSIVIAHRLSTIEKCDRILVLESGCLVEEGAFTELKNKDGGIFS
jgi:ABC-type multidrug transport system fused ATPase/permease subunit